MRRKGLRGGGGMKFGSLEENNSRPPRMHKILLFQKTPEMLIAVADFINKAKQNPRFRSFFN